MKDNFYKDFLDEDLRIIYRKLNKILEIKDGEPFLNEKIINQLPSKMSVYILKHKDKFINVFHVASAYGVLIHEMAKRFAKFTVVS
jgi:hypothetical protein